MKDKKTKSETVWISISHIDMPQSNWIWWVIEGTLDTPGEGSRSYNSLHAMQENLRTRGFNPPASVQINEIVLQARIDGKDEATFQVSSPQSAK